MAINMNDFRLITNVDLDSNYNHTIDFDNITEQSNFFEAHIDTSIVLYDDYSYIRQNETVKVPYNIDDIFNDNYLCYNNDNKTYYCFITRKEYINEECTRLYIKTDVLQTYMFDVEWKDSFIERQHEDRFEVLYDEDGYVSGLAPNYSNTTDEGLSIGDDYETNNEKLQIDYGSNSTEEKVYPMFAIAYLRSPTTTQTDGTQQRNEKCNIEGISTGFLILMGMEMYNEENGERYTVHINETTDERYRTISEMIEDYSGFDQVQQIIVTSIPPFQIYIKKLSNGRYVYDGDNSSVSSYKVEKTGSPGEYHYTLQITEIRPWTNKRPTLVPCRNIKPSDKLDLFYQTYGPEHIHEIFRETKLFQYPYHFNKLLFGGNEIIIKDEFIPQEGTRVIAYQSLSGDASSAIILPDYLNVLNKYNIDPDFPNNYDNLIDLNNAKILTNQLPNFIDLTTTEWQKYMLQNKAQRSAGFTNTGIGLAGSIIGAAASVASGNFLGGLAAVGAGINAYQQISSLLAKEKDIQSQPADVRQFNGDALLQRQLTSFLPLLERFSIFGSAFYRIYDYFYHYGYKCNKYLTPNNRSRYYFNYIKTIECNIIGNIPQDDLNEIKNIYNKGVTIWHIRKNINWKGMFNYDYENVEMYVWNEIQNNRRPEL